VVVSAHGKPANQPKPYDHYRSCVYRRNCADHSVLRDPLKLKARVSNLGLSNVLIQSIVARTSDEPTKPYTFDLHMIVQYGRTEAIALPGPASYKMGNALRRVRRSGYIRNRCQQSWQFGFQRCACSTKRGVLWSEDCLDYEPGDLVHPFWPADEVRSDSGSRMRSF
jgi:hypothetical protein